MLEAAATPSPARIEYLRVENFRALRRVEFKNLTPLTVLLGPNGSGKSTVFDVFAFLAECFDLGLRRAWDRRGRARELKTRGQDGPVTIEIKYRERPNPKSPLITYHLSVDELGGNPIVEREWLRWKRQSFGAPFRFLEYERGIGRAASGEEPDEQAQRVEIPLESADLLAVNALGQFKEHPRVAALRHFIRGWHLSYLAADSARIQPEAGPHERLTTSGDNLANIIQHLREQHPERLTQIFDMLQRRIPCIESVSADQMPDGRLLLQVKDAPFSSPIMARFASDGTLKLLAYLVLMHDPTPPAFIGLEEPENFLHPRLLYGLAEECRAAAGRTQLLVTTHSPFFLNALRPNEVWVLYRDDQGHTRNVSVASASDVLAFMDEGAELGWLWTEGYFGVGDPLQSQGGPERAEGAPQK